MTRRRQVLIAVAAAATLLSVSYLAVRPQAEPVGVEIPVCAGDVPAGTRLEPGMLATARVPVDLIPDGAVRSAEDAVGRITDVGLRKGELLSEGRLSEEAGGVLHAGAGTGRRIAALSLAAEDAAGWWLSVGSRVDVHLLLPDGGGGTVHEVLPDLRVAALLDAKGNPVEAGARGAAPALLCLDVDEAQAARLAEAGWEGRIKAIIVNETMK